VPNHASSSDAPSSPPIWPYVVAFLALIAIGLVFGELAEAARQQVPDAFDLRVTTWVSLHHQDWPFLERLFRWITWLGDTRVATTATALVALVLVVLGRQRKARLRTREALFWLSVALSGRFLCSVLKLRFARARPPLNMHRVVIVDQSYSFPSGHSTFAAVFFTMLAILIARALPRSLKWLRYAAIACCASMALLVGASRVWLGVHYPTDVAGGLLLGLGWVIIAYMIRFGWARWWLWRSLRAAKAGSEHKGGPRSIEA
jgi:undecaprenyl-diphosphatase